MGIGLIQIDCVRDFARREAGLDEPLDTARVLDVPRVRCCKTFVQTEGERIGTKPTQRGDHRLAETCADA